jgi:hypothetical protein
MVGLGGAVYIAAILALDVRGVRARIRLLLP